MLLSPCHICHLPLRLWTMLSGETAVATSRSLDRDWLAAAPPGRSLLLCWKSLKFLIAWVCLVFISATYFKVELLKLILSLWVCGWRLRVLCDGLLTCRVYFWVSKKSLIGAFVTMWEMKISAGVSFQMSQAFLLKRASQDDTTTYLTDSPAS